MDIPAKKTKIVCTIGPATWDQAVLERLIQSGMDIARINFAHGDLAGHRRTIANVRAAAQAVGRRVAIFGDLPGPKMRIGKLEPEPLALARGQPFTLQAGKGVGDQAGAWLDFAGLPQAVKPGDSIFMNDGYIQLRVERVAGRQVHCTVQVGGKLRSHQGVNFPGIDLGISAFTERDRDLLAFAAAQKLDGVSQSFVLGPEDMDAVRRAAAALDYDPFLIAKIERAGALDHIPAILQAADGIMVARGDLGVEIPIEQVPAVQKRLIRQANLAAKPVITATQMLESMTNNRRPTRAEVTDVANAILDGTDGVMLSGETAVGQYPVEAVALMGRIAQETEADVSRFAIADLLQLQQARGEISRDDLLSLTVFLAAQTLQPDVIVAPARSGATAQRLARFGPRQWIIAPSHFEPTCQRLQFSYGIHPVHVAEEAILVQPELRRRYAGEWLQAHGLEKGTVLMVEGAGTLKAEDTKRIDIIDLG